MVTTNLLDDDGGGGETRGFSWIDDYRIKWRKNRNGEKSMQAVRVILGRRLLQRHPEEQASADLRQPVLSARSPLEKRLYEIARAHVGNKPGFKMGLEKLRLRVGCATELRCFKSKLESDLQAQVPAARLWPEPDRPAYPALARSKGAEADGPDAAQELPGLFLSGPTGWLPCCRAAESRRCSKSWGTTYDRQGVACSGHWRSGS